MWICSVELLIKRWLCYCAPGLGRGYPEKLIRCIVESRQHEIRSTTLYMWLICGKHSFDGTVVRNVFVESSFTVYLFDFMYKYWNSSISVKNRLSVLPSISKSDLRSSNTKNNDIKLKFSETFGIFYSNNSATWSTKHSDFDLNLVIVSSFHQSSKLPLGSYLRPWSSKPIESTKKPTLFVRKITIQINWVYHAWFHARQPNQSIQNWDMMDWNKDCNLNYEKIVLVKIIFSAKNKCSVLTAHRSAANIGY